MLQKSSYYSTRKKDKSHIMYITNARSAHWCSLFQMVEQILPLKLSHCSQEPLKKEAEVWCWLLLLWSEVRKWHVALHSSAALIGRLWISLMRQDEQKCPLTRTGCVKPCPSGPARRAYWNVFHRTVFLATSPGSHISYLHARDSFKRRWHYMGVILCLGRQTTICHLASSWNFFKKS